jgi:DNA-binding IclR family transcriptional regulator
MREDLRRIRERGYSLDDSENTVGFRCIGSPIFGPGGKVEGAMSIEAPASRFSDEVYLPLVPSLWAATFDISIAIGADYRRMAVVTPPTAELP